MSGRTDASYSAQQLRDFAAELKRRAREPFADIPVSKEAALRIANHIDVVHAEFTQLLAIARTGRKLRDVMRDFAELLNDEGEVSG